MKLLFTLVTASVILSATLVAQQPSKVDVKLAVPAIKAERRAKILLIQRDMVTLDRQGKDLQSQWQILRQQYETLQNELTQAEEEAYKESGADRAKVVIDQQTVEFKAKPEEPAKPAKK